MLPTDQNEPLARKILNYLALAWDGILPPQKGYRNTAFPVTTKDGVTLNLIIYKQEPGIAQKIKDANAVGDFAAAHGLPARQTADQRIVRLASGDRHKYAALYNYLPGHTIPWEAYTKAHLKLLGKSMSDLHACLKTAPPPQTNVTHEYLAITRRMQRYFADPQVTKVLARKLGLGVKKPYFDHAAALLNACAHIDQLQPLHMDFVRSNILFDGEGDSLRISGILDFEKTAYGHPIFDIARTLAFLLVDCKYTPSEKVRKYFLYSGYAKQGGGPLINPGVRAPQGRSTLLDELLDLFLLYDFYKFLRHNPYEFLPQNEHFVRTREQLLHRKLIAVVE